MSQIMNISKEEEYRGRVMNSFKAGERYTKKEIKSILQKVRNDLGMSGVSKATDLNLYFKLTQTTLLSKETGKLEKAFRLDPL